MATLNGVNSTKRDVNVPSEKIQPGDEGGRLRVMYDSFTSTGAIALNDVIRMMKLPKGARVHNVVLDHDDLGTVGTCTVGWEASSDGAESADPNGFLDTVNLNSAANTVEMIDEASVPGMMKEFSAEVQVSITITQATDAAGTLQLAVWYVID